MGESLWRRIWYFTELPTGSLIIRLFDTVFKLYNKVSPDQGSQVLGNNPWALGDDGDDGEDEYNMASL